MRTPGLPTGGTLEFFRRIDVDALDPDLKPAPGILWGGMRIFTFTSDRRFTVLYVAQCDARCLTAQFHGNEEEEKLADALFDSLRRASTFSAGEVEAAPNAPSSVAIH